METKKKNAEQRGVIAHAAEDSLPPILRINPEVLAAALPEAIRRHRETIQNPAHIRRYREVMKRIAETLHVTELQDGSAETRDASTDDSRSKSIRPRQED